MESCGSGREKQRRIAQWNAYELERKKDCIANKLQFEKDLESLERVQTDVERAMDHESGKDAAAQVQHAVLHGVPAKPSDFLQGALQAAQSNPVDWLMPTS
ncbi:hypothetical protein AK812_SmicGene27744 [Symbiodinium microadriaticum]|uniref:Uncharacterized protein n=1 Tax=Symbiodinium microadriaticum TaxID=2951 RepID=A0A1Q9D6A0_SYMMI|nr:hypothetical protein AK812_SmicGene27744 [Symbiodinium microadriaticum]